MKTPGALVEASASVVPSVSVPVCVVESVSVPVCMVPSVVPVCVVSRCMFTSELKCVLRRTHAGSVRARERRCVPGATSVSVPPCLDETPSVSPSEEASPCLDETPSVTPCVEEPPCVDEPPSTSESPCASGVVASEPACVLPGTPCVKGAPQAEGPWVRVTRHGV